MIGDTGDINRSELIFLIYFIAFFYIFYIQQISYVDVGVLNEGCWTL